MRDPNIGSPIAYAPGAVPADTADISRYLADELRSISAAIASLANLHAIKTHVEPVRPREGDIRYSDGTNWDAGHGEGLYLYDGTEWRPIGGLDSGSITPTLVSSGGGAPTYTAQVGYYTRLGNRVFFQLRVQLATLGTLAAGNLTIAGLPIATNGTSGNIPTFTANGRIMAITATTQLCADATAGSTSVRLLVFNAGIMAVLTVADITGTSIIDVTGSYMV